MISQLAAQFVESSQEIPKHHWCFPAGNAGMLLFAPVGYGFPITEHLVSRWWYDMEHIFVILIHCESRSIMQSDTIVVKICFFSGLWAVYVMLERTIDWPVQLADLLSIVWKDSSRV